VLLGTGALSKSAAPFYWERGRPRPQSVRTGNKRDTDLCMLRPGRGAGEGARAPSNNKCGTRTASVPASQLTLSGDARMVFARAR
jgi:hypothetical protein